MVCDSVDEVEDEMHFLLKCPKYVQLRTSMLDSVSRACPLINISNDRTSHLFKCIMANTNKDVIQSVATYISHAFRVRENVLLDRNILLV